MVLGFPRSDRIAMRDAMEEQARHTREQESRLAARMRRAAERRDTLEDLRRAIATIEHNTNAICVRSREIPDEVA